MLYAAGGPAGLSPDHVERVPMILGFTAKLDSNQIGVLTVAGVRAPV